jgi:hypothetical protein
MLEQLDELIESLLGFRQWLVEEGPRTTATPSASRRRRRANGLASVALAAARLAASTTSAYGQAAPDTAARLDDEGLFGGIDQVLHEVTLTGEYKFARRLPRARGVPS